MNTPSVAWRLVLIYATLLIVVPAVFWGSLGWLVVRWIT